MKKYITTLVLVIIAFSSCAQNNSSNTLFVRHDTTTLKAAECEWIIKSLTINDPELTVEIGKSVPLVILQAIEKGRLTAIDPVTNKTIPAKEIYRWQIAADTVGASDAAGNMKYKIVKAERSSTNFSLIRIYQDWYFDIPTAKLRSVIRCIELLEEIHTNYSGLFTGYRPFCRIYY